MHQGFSTFQENSDFNRRLWRVTDDLQTKERRLEERLGTAEPLIADGDDLSIRKLVALFQGGRGSCCLHLLLKVKSHVTELLLDVTHDFTLGWRSELTVKWTLHGL